MLFLNLLHILDPRFEGFNFHVDVLLRGRVQSLHFDLLVRVHHILALAQTANPAFQGVWQLHLPRVGAFGPPTNFTGLRSAESARLALVDSVADFAILTLGFGRLLPCEDRVLQPEHGVLLVPNCSFGEIPDFPGFLHQSTDLLSLVFVYGSEDLKGPGGQNRVALILLDELLGET